MNCSQAQREGILQAVQHEAEQLGREAGGESSGEVRPVKDRHDAVRLHSLVLHQALEGEEDCLVHHTHVVSGMVPVAGQEHDDGAAAGVALRQHARQTVQQGRLDAGGAAPAALAAPAHVQAAEQLPVALTVLEVAAEEQEGVAHPELSRSQETEEKGLVCAEERDVGSGRQEGVELLRRVSLVGHRDEIFASLSLVVEAVLLTGEGPDVVVVGGTPGALQVTHVHVWGRRLQRAPQRRPKHLGVFGGVLLGRRAGEEPVAGR